MRSTHVASDFVPQEIVKLSGGKFTGTWEVESVSRVNCSVVQRDPSTGQVIRRVKPCAPVFMWKHNEEIPSVQESIAVARRTYWFGQFIEVKAPNPKYNGIYMVGADNGTNVRVAKPGGENGRYYRFPKEWVTLLTVSEAVGRLSDQVIQGLFAGV